MEKRKITILVTNSIIAHYRSELYRELDALEDFSFTFAHDPRDEYYNVKVADNDIVKKTITIKNVHIFRLMWQIGIVREAISSNYDAYIFTGDVSIVSTWISAAILRMRNKKVFFWTIGWHRPESGLKKKLRISFYRLANHLLLYAPRAKNLGILHGYKPERMSVVYNSVSNAIDNGMTRVAPEGHNKKIFRIGAIARLTKGKRFDMLLESVAKIDPLECEIQITLVGDGPERDRLKQLAQNLGVRTDFRGSLYASDEIESIYRNLDLTVLPSIAGLTTMQSLAHGVPVITHNNLDIQAPEMEAIIPGKTGDLYQHEDLDDLSRVLLHWSRKTSEERQAIASYCIEEINKRWSPKSQSSQISNTIRQSM